MRSLYINPKDSKTYDTFQEKCKKNIPSLRQVVQGQQGGGYEHACDDGRGELAQQRPKAAVQRHAVHLPVALHEVDAERGDDAPCHRFERAEVEDAQQHARHVEHRREQAADEQAARVSRCLEDAAGRGEDDLHAHREGEDAEHGHGGQPLRAEDDERQLLRGEEEQHAQGDADESEQADDALVGGAETGEVVLVVAEDGVHHGGDHLGDVLQGEHHQTVRLLVVTQLRHAHVLAYQQLVEVAAEVVDDVEQELVGGVGEDLAQGAQSEGGRGVLRVAPDGDEEDEGAGEDGADEERIQSRTAQGGGHRGGAACHLQAEASQGDEFELFVLVEQGVGHDVGRSEKEVDAEQLAQGAQDGAVVVGGNGPRGGEEEQRERRAHPEGEGEDAGEVAVGQRLVLDDGGGDAHVGEEIEKGDDDGGDGHHAEVVGREQARQYAGDDEGDNDAAVFGQRGVKHAGEELLFEVACHRG